MNHLIICNSPYQVFNAINVLVNDIEMNHNECDILLDDSLRTFKNKLDIGANLLSHGICRNVYYAEKKEDTRKHSKIGSFLYLLRKNHLDQYIYSDDGILIKSYDSVWVGDGNTFGYSMYEKNKKTEIVWYDDGAASYVYSPRNFGHSKFHELLMKTFRLASYKYKPGKLFVNNISMAQAKEFSVHQLPLLNNQNPAKDEIGFVFDYKYEASYPTKYRAIILGQMLSGMEGYNGTELQALLKNTGIDSTNTVVRKHPRDKNSYIGFNVDEGINMWELECINSITDSHVLFSCCSTAQLTPKLIGTKEPYLVFLYKLLLNPGSHFITVCNEIVDNISNMYSDKTKIIVPDNLEKLNRSISHVLLGNNIK